MIMTLILTLKIKFNTTANKSAVKCKKMVNPLIHLLIEATTRIKHVNQVRKQWNVKEE